MWLCRRLINNPLVLLTDHCFCSHYLLTPATSLPERGCIFLHTPEAFMALHTSPRKLVPLPPTSDDDKPRQRAESIGSSTTKRVFFCGVIVEGSESGKRLPDSAYSKVFVYEMLVILQYRDPRRRSVSRRSSRPRPFRPCRITF